MPEFFDVVLGQRAHRDLLPDPLPDEVVERLLLAATHAPSAENRQPWAFVVVRDPDVRAAIGDLTRAVWEGGARDFVRGRLGARLFADVDRWATGGLARAPVVVVVCGDTSAAEPGALAASLYPATQNLLLAAQALGLGALLSTLPTVRHDDLAALLELPAHLRAMAVVPIGRPARALPAPRRIPVRDKAFRDRYGRRW
ncbi:MAG TPA: nitroreductase family protein [Candidatus Binatia bacterium]|nr:nitroreductase family protein [Candidatus Binatia bacterium]